MSAGSKAFHKAVASARKQLLRPRLSFSPFALYHGCRCRSRESHKASAQSHCGGQARTVQKVKRQSCPNFGEEPFGSRPPWLPALQVWRLPGQWQAPQAEVFVPQPGWLSFLSSLQAATRFLEQSHLEPAASATEELPTEGQQAEEYLEEQQVTVEQLHHRPDAVSQDPRLRAAGGFQASLVPQGGSSSRPASSSRQGKTDEEAEDEVPQTGQPEAEAKADTAPAVQGQASGDTVNQTVCFREQVDQTPLAKTLAYGLVGSFPASLKKLTTSALSEARTSRTAKFTSSKELLNSEAEGAAPATLNVRRIAATIDWYKMLATVREREYRSLVEWKSDSRPDAYTLACIDLFEMQPRGFAKKLPEILNELEGLLAERLAGSCVQISLTAPAGWTDLSVRGPWSQVVISSPCL